MMLQSVSIILGSIAIISVFVVLLLWLYTKKASVKNKSVFDLSDEIQKIPNDATSDVASKDTKGNLVLKKRSPPLGQKFRFSKLDDASGNEAMELISILKQLADLRDTGVITDEEFKTLKSKILEQI
jgi:FtsZ-interacting cell division protein ZipA